MDDPKDLGTDTGDMNANEEPGLTIEEPDPATQAMLAQIDRLAQERDRAGDEAKRLLDQLARSRAEFDNFRKRNERERRELLDYAAMDTVREMLPVLDGLERALVTTAKTGAGNEACAELRAGIEHIARQMYDTLTRMGLRPIPAIGEAFDPHLHEAIETVETDEYEDHTVVDEWQRGYRFKEKLLRPAMVKVAVRPEPK
jgi:molecular chaperone GrpE